MPDKPIITAKALAINAVLATLLLILQVVLAPLPNIEFITLLVILYTLILKKHAIYIIMVFVLLEGLIYGFGIWWISYLYVWPILFGITFLLRRFQSPFFWAVTASLFGLFFGLLCSISYLFSGGIGAAFAWWISGIPFDILHGISNFFIVLFLFSPLYRVLDWLVKQ